MWILFYLEITKKKKKSIDLKAVNGIVYKLLIPCDFSELIYLYNPLVCCA